MKHLFILCRVLLCAMLLLFSLSASAQTAPVAEAVSDTTSLSTTDFMMPRLSKGDVFGVVGIIFFAVIILVSLVHLFITLRKAPNHEQQRRKTYKKTGKDPRQVKLTITCDEGYTADFLRELATEIENRDDDDDACPDFEYETFHGYAEITTEN